MLYLDGIVSVNFERMIPQKCKSDTIAQKAIASRNTTKSDTIAQKAITSRNTTKSDTIAQKAIASRNTTKSDTIAQKAIASQRKNSNAFLTPTLAHAHNWQWHLRH